MKSFVCFRSLALMVLVITSHFLGSCQTKRSKSSSSAPENITPQQGAGNSTTVNPDTDSAKNLADKLKSVITKFNQSTDQPLPVPSDTQELADAIDKNGETAAAMTHVALAEQGISPDASTDPTGSTGGMMWLPFISNTHLEEVGIGASIAAVSIGVGLVAVSQYRYWKVRQVFQANKKKLANAETLLKSAIAVQTTDPDFIKEKAAQDAKVAAAQVEVRRLEANAASKASDLAAAKQHLSDLNAEQKRLQDEHAAKGRLVNEARTIVADASSAVERATAAFTALASSDAALDREIVHHEAQLAAARQAATELEGKVQPLTEAERVAQARFEELERAKVEKLAEQRAKVETAMAKQVALREEEQRLRQLVHPELQKELDAKADLPPKGWFEWARGPSPERAAALARLGTASADAERAYDTYTHAKKAADTALEEYEKIRTAAEAANKTADVAALRGQGALAEASRQVLEAKAAVAKAKDGTAALEQGLSERKANSDALKARVAADNDRLRTLTEDLAAKRTREVALHGEQVAAGAAQTDAQRRVAAQAAEVDRLAREQAFADNEKSLAADRLADEQKVKPKAASAGVDAAQASKDALTAEQAKTSKLLESRGKNAKGFGIAGALFGAVGVGILVPAAVGMAKGKDELGLASNDPQAVLLADLKDLELRWQRLYGRQILEAQAAQKK